MANNKYFLFLFLFISLLIDQVIKHGTRFKSGFYVCNKNIALGFEIPVSIASLSGFIIIAYIYFYLKKEKVKKTDLALAFIIFGATLNLSDRFLFGCVVDYFLIFNNFPQFNIADIYIFIGTSIILYKIMTTDK